MNHGFPPPTPPASGSMYRRNSSGSEQQRNYYQSALDTGDVSGYQYARTIEDNRSMLYFKDKPLQKNSMRMMVRVMRQFVWRNPWRAASILLTVCCFILLLGGRGRSQHARLLKEMDVKSVDQAITLWKRRSAANADLRKLYLSQGKWEKRDTAWKHHVEKLQNHTQRESMRAVIDKFGVGPFHVQIKFVLDYYLKEKKTYSDEHIGTFEIELAPLKEMPHSVHLFLEQISHGLWSNRQGLAFHINTNHILLGGPTTKEARKVFQQYNLDHLAFPEYSESFPHDEYTLGFSGRPGGPSFYINTANNSHVHGPGGQTQHALSEFADACFAKVVSGFDALHDIIEETDANHQTLIIDMKIIEWDGRYREKDDAEWYDATESVVKPPEDDYSDDVYYGESSGASYADDDKGYAARVGEEKHDALDAKENGHKIHRHHHGENFQQQREEEELLAAGPPRLVEPPPDMLVHLTELQRDKAEA